MTASTPVPGWYHDPADARLVRWWDGAAWTEHVQDAAAVSAPTAETTAPSAETTVASATFAAPSATHTATAATPEGFLLPDPQASPGRRPDPPTARRSALETAPPPQLPSRRERRQLESAASQSGASPQSGATPTSDAVTSAPRVTEATPPVVSADVAADAAASTKPESAPAAPSITGPQPTQPVVDLRIPPLEAFDDPGVAAFAAFESPVPGPTATSRAAERVSAPAALEPARSAMPDFPAAVSPATSTAPRTSAIVPDAPRASGTGSVGLYDAPIVPSSDDEGFARPWVSVASGAVPLSAVELASVDYEPLPRGVMSPSRSLPPAPTRAATVSAWMLALSPLIVPLVLVGALIAAASVSGASLSASAAPLSLFTTVDTGSLAIVGGALLAVALMLIVWVSLDRRALERFGFQHRASGFWIVLGPLFYLVARAAATRRGGRGNASPAWVHVVAVIAVAALGVAAPYLAPREATVAEMRTVEQNITQDLQSQDLGLTVACPDTSDARIGSTFACEALSADNAVVGAITVRWAGVDGSIQYSVELGELPIEAAN